MHFMACCDTCPTCGRERMTFGHAITCKKAKTPTYDGKSSPRPPEVTVALHKCRNYPQWEIRDGKWILFCENCDEVVT